MTDDGNRGTIEAGENISGHNSALPTSNQFERKDWFVMLLLTALAAVVYLPFLYWLPYQINTDEFAIRDCILGLPPLKADWQYLLGPSNYNGFPTLVHVVFGMVAQLLGGVSFVHLREAHALFGVACAPLAFFFFRSLSLNRSRASAATLIVIFNHALVAISRMVSRNNTSLFIELAALAVLFRAFEKRNRAMMGLGGLIAGLSFYTYTPARTTFPTFLLAVFLIALVDRKRSPVTLFKTIAPALVTFALSVAPMLWLTAHSPTEINQYQNGQFLFTAAGLTNQEHQVEASSWLQGYLVNVAQGLSAFNLPIPDNGYIYINDHAGFLDFITGLMLWVGMFTIVFQRKQRKQERDADILCASGFLGLVFVYAFLITFAPDYTRLFTTLPFIAYLSVQGISALSLVLARLIEMRMPTFSLSSRADQSTTRIAQIISIGCTALALSLVYPELPLWARVFSVPIVLAIAWWFGTDILARLFLGYPRKRSRLEHKLFWCLIGLIVLSNCAILWMYSYDGIYDGQVHGATYRYKDERAREGNRNFVLVVEPSHPYYHRGIAIDWANWVDGSRVDSHTKVLDPGSLEFALSGRATNLNRPVTIFMEEGLWRRERDNFTKYAPDFKVTRITTKEGRVAVDLP